MLPARIVNRLKNECSEMQQHVRDELITDAIANARHRADIAAEAAGMEVSGIQSITLNDVYFPIFYRNAALQSSEGSTQTLPSQQEVSMSVSATYFVQQTQADKYWRRSWARDSLPSPLSSFSTIYL